ncbi:MAG: winged helix-turn-helix transcriptional regulator [Acaryochloridaceae cyanobacterium SU_2_1]|nr:winged helix-turn-helix transcriptional regulator [Acaryochloridaceae cyanobacterium SU_2_1]NJM95346.1 winged helix-turn-helix transcriptional regulator [Acaryochloridaceae cyanobacterium CSU_5_19]
MQPAQSCAYILKILADATRLSILKLLMSGPQHVNQLNAVLKLEQSLLSHHLKVLRQAGLVQATRDGKAVLYQLAPKIQSSHASEGLDLGCCEFLFTSFSL